MRRVIISISVMRETSDLIEECGDDSSASEAHCGGWEGLGKNGGEPSLCLGNRDAPMRRARTFSAKEEK
ncbi:MAG: hypothetical protein OEZ52_05520 [Candidatus Aminicenantes bacterium]|nr:hypothetical protein [Candidatus Aminicenantes bacterium]MDH5742979.1 hypothetical protein [Candidatus Aminicenantes bacterium]